MPLSFCKTCKAEVSLGLKDCEAVSSKLFWGFALIDGGKPLTVTLDRVGPVSTKAFQQP